MTGVGDATKYDYFVNGPADPSDSGSQLEPVHLGQLRAEKLATAVDVELRAFGDDAGLLNGARSGMRLVPCCVAALRERRRLLSVPLVMAAIGGAACLLYTIAAGGTTALLGGDKLEVVAKVLPLAALLCSLGAVGRAVVVAATTTASGGGAVTIRRACTAALSHLPALLLLGFAQASIDTASFLLRRGRLSRLAANAVDVTWDFTTALAVPAIVLEGKNVAAAIRRSTQLVMTCWGPQLRTRPMISLAVAVCSFPFVLLGIAIAVAFSTTAGDVIVSATITLAVAVAAVLNGVLSAAIYCFATASSR